MRYFAPALFIIWVAIALCAGAPARADSGLLPTALSDVISFRGQLRYHAHTADDPQTTIIGTLKVTSGAWSFEERSARTLVFASNQQSWLQTGSQTVVFDDPLDVDAIANIWAVLLASFAGEHPIRDPGGASWTTGAGARIYLDAGQTGVIGAVDTRSSASYAFDQWVSVNGLRLPQSIVRLRDGVVVASFVIDGYEVDQTTNTAQSALHVATARNYVQPASPPTPAAPARPSGLALLALAMTALVLALGLVAWFHRDGIADRLSRRLADDPRAWRDEGTNVFVSPEGVLFFDGRPYRVGFAFYARQALVQSSPLFIRVSAPGVPRAVVLARKSRLALRPVAARRSSAGFTLVEALAASAVFAAVVVAAVFPTLIVLAHADRLAAQRELALQIATNALADEQSALAYGLGIIDESRITSVDGMTVTETLTPAGLAGLHTLAVEVADSGGHPLARVVTQIGPPVPTPGGPSPAPSGMSR